MLWLNIKRWKFQRKRIGKLPAKIWCLISVCIAVNIGLSRSKPASNNKCCFSLTHNNSGEVLFNQSTTLPITANNKASKPPSIAVTSVITRINQRKPKVHDQTNGHNDFGGSGSSCSGKGFKRFSNQASIGHNFSS